MEISWNPALGGVTGYTVAYATKSDYSDAKVLEVSADTTSISVYNLYKGTTYYVKVTARGLNQTVESTFTTTSVGPRVMHVEGVYNMRDLGGYTTSSGKTTKQGLIYRSGALTPCPSDSAYDEWVQITDAGIQTMSEELGIKSEIDFRVPSDSGGLTESLIPGATLTYCTLGSYSAINSYKSVYGDVFAMMADESNYPILYHCTGGADRTGTVSFILNALLGVDEQTLIQDYEFTSFSLYGSIGGDRNTQTTVYDYAGLRTALSAYGDTLQEQAENYLLSCGLTETQIYNIRAIMFGEETKEEPEEEPDEEVVPNSFFDYMNSPLTVTLDSTTTTATSDSAVGYGQTVRIPMTADMINTIGGGIYAFVGSYGIYLRGDEFRIATLNTSGSMNVIGRDLGYACPFNIFEDGGYLDLCVTDNGTDIVITVAATGNSLVTTYSATHTVAAASRLSSGEIASADAKITVSINTGEVSKLTIDGENVVSFKDYMNAGSAVTLNSSTTQVKSDLAVGYGNSVRINMDLDQSGASGRTYVYVGSYGVCFRGGQFRLYSLTSSGTMTEITRLATPAIPTNIFENGGYLDIMITPSGNDVTFTLTAYDNAAATSYTTTHTQTGCRISDEIASENAKITVSIDTSEISSLTIS